MHHQLLVTRQGHLQCNSHITTGNVIHDIMTAIDMDQDITAIVITGQVGIAQDIDVNNVAWLITGAK